MIREIVEAGINKPDRPWPKRPGKSRLWASELGRCPRRAMLRVTGVEMQGSFPAHVREVMALGAVYEDVTLDWLRKGMGPGKGSVTGQQRVGSEIWSGKIDFLVQDAEGHAVIVEHKATGDRWWNYNENLPHSDHVCQAMLYGQLWSEKNGIAPDVILYYVSWGHYAEFVLTESDDGVRAKGTMDGEPVSKWTWVAPSKLRAELEELWRTEVVPPAPRTPSDAQGCTFRGSPSCGYYEHCFPKGGGNG